MWMLLNRHMGCEGCILTWLRLRRLVANGGNPL